MELQYCSQGYNTFQWGMFMLGIIYYNYNTIWCGSWVKRNISIHEATLGECIEKHDWPYWWCIWHVTYKHPIHDSGRGYCLPTRHMNVSKPVEMCVYIGSWPCDNFFIDWTCLVREVPKSKLLWWMRLAHATELQPMQWSSNAVPMVVTTHSNEVYLYVESCITTPSDVVHE